jgi:SpoVK/Ycf46/Vps4 family AAA+-type ATPase
MSFIQTEDIMAAKRNRRIAHSYPQSAPPCEELVVLWVLRILVHLGAIETAIAQENSIYGGGEYITNPKIRDLLGLSADHLANEEDDGEIDKQITRAQRRVLMKTLRLKLSKVERNFPGLTPPPALAANVAQLADLVNLNEAESRLLMFTVILKTSDELQETTELLGNLRNNRAYAVLARILDLRLEDVVPALNKKGTLAQSGLLRLDTTQNYTLFDKLDLLSNAFAERMVSEEAAPLDLLRDTISPSLAPTLKWDDFQHMERDLGILRLHLRKGLETRLAGINILIHGLPGTGKTETARLLASELGADLFEVASEDEVGDPISGNARMRAYRAGQVLLAQSSAILLFDEAEDIFGRGSGMGLFALFGGKDGEAQQRKAWINKALETNRAPTLWLTNSIDGIDPAFMRRFDMLIEMPIPPRQQRERIVSQNAEGMLPPETLNRLSQSEHLAPAVVARAIAVIKNIREDMADADISGAIEHLVDNTLRAQGHPMLQRMTTLPALYDPALINASANLAELAKGLSRAKRGRLCLFGPPGTGKTAFAHWLAEQLGRPLMIKRASDLIDKWVGASERNIAEAFRTAANEGAVLLLDEVDSFLQDRRGAQRSWEVTQVNEMLTQMEAFNGVFIASTNMVDGLDQAALRRFDLKLKFGYLKPIQAWDLFERQCTALNLPVPDESLRSDLLRLDQLTPGDFAAVARRHNFSPLADASALLTALTEECAIKEGGQNHAMGFIGA